MQTMSSSARATGARQYSWTRLRARPSRGAALVLIGVCAVALIALAAGGTRVRTLGLLGAPETAGAISNPAKLAASPVARVNAPPPASAMAGGAPVPLGAPAAAVGDAPAASTALSSTAIDASAAQTLDHMVIRTAQLGVEVSDMEATLGQVRAIAARGGGFVSASTTRLERVDDQDRTVADLTLQVRSDTADATMSDLRALGKVTTESSGSQDVTEEYVDLDANLRNLQASETAIVGLMNKATRIEDVLSLQRELTNIRSQIERIQGRKRYLERRTDMATITLALRLPAAESARAGASGAWNPLAVAARGFQASLALLRSVADAVIVALAFSWWLVPFAAGAVYLLLQRRRDGGARSAPTTLAADG